MAGMETQPKLQLSRTKWGGLDCTLLAPESKAAAPPVFCTILCHGFGAPGTDLVPLGPDLAAMCPEQAGRTLFVFPQGPLDLAAMGMPGARAWWMIDIERFQRAVGNPEKMARFRHEIPSGMPESCQSVRRMLADIERETGIPAGRTILGGFSQGSMVATDTALRLPQAAAGLCVFSGSLIAEDEWRSLAAKRGSLPVLQSHGYFDPILPFAGAEALRDMLTQASLPVDFLAFEGPHTIPFEALERLADLMRRVFRQAG